MTNWTRGFSVEPGYWRLHLAVVFGVYGGAPSTPLRLRHMREICRAVSNG
jgi:hypothetical protein